MTRITEIRNVLKAKGTISEQTIFITGNKTSDCPIPLRRIGYRDPETGKHYVFLTSNFTLAAKTITDIYKALWQIKLFFMCSNQNLEIKSFSGTSRSAVLTQLWIAMCLHLVLPCIMFCNRIHCSIQQMIHLLQLNLFEQCELLPLLRGDPAEPLDATP